MTSVFPKSNKLNFILRYGQAILLVALALGITLLIYSVIKPMASPLFLMTIAFTAWYLGLRAGILATVLSGIVLNYFFVSPEYQLNGHIDDISRLIFFTLEGTVLSCVLTSRIRAAEEIKSSREQLQALSLRHQTLLEEERRRIALEIHDELGQSLTGLKMEIHQLKKQTTEKEKPSDPLETENKFKDIGLLIDATIASVRRIATELRPALLDDLGLIAAIEWQGREFHRRTGISCVVSTNVENIELNSSFSTAVFRIFQETLTNVTRHAEAETVRVKLEKFDEILILRVEDDGRGIKLENVDKNSSLGILGMHERARLIGADLKVLSGEKRGTIVELNAPISTNQNGSIKSE